MKKLVIFDLDGTLLNTIEDLGNAVNDALKNKGFPQHSLIEYKKMVGNGVRNLVTRALPEEMRSDDGVIDSTLEDFFKYYRTHIYVCTHPYPGIPELLEKLRRDGYLFAVASNKFQEGTEALIKHFFPQIPFICILGNEAGRPLKPSPEIVRTAVDKAKALTGGNVPAIMVGDSGIDISTAAAAGIPAVGVSWGFRSGRELTGAHRIADDAESLYCAITDSFA